MRMRELGVNSALLLPGIQETSRISRLAKMKKNRRIVVKSCGICHSNNGSMLCVPESTSVDFVLGFQISS